MPTQFPTTIELSQLDSRFGLTINGATAGDRLGNAVNGIGDINNDGISDIAVGAYFANSHRGVTYVIFGGRTLSEQSSFEVTGLNGLNGFQMIGMNTFDECGFSVSPVGDFNKDGIDDFIVGAWIANPSGSQSGQAYLIYGATDIGSSGVFELTSLNGANGFIMNGITATERTGNYVSHADVNNDGFDDLLVSAYIADPNGIESGKVYVIYGTNSTLSSPFLLSSIDGKNGLAIHGITAYDLTGHALAGLGDINHDGYDDILIGAYQADPDGKNRAGRAYVVFGNQTLAGGSASLELSDLDGTNGFKIDGLKGTVLNPPNGDGMSHSVSAAGDVNGDGLGDFIIGAGGASPYGMNAAGESYLIFGNSLFGSSGLSSYDLLRLNSYNGVTITGSNTGDGNGHNIGMAGDINCDGFTDVIIPAVTADPHGIIDAGTVIILFGQKTLGNNGLFAFNATNGWNGFAINGIEASDLLGTDQGAGYAGDVNADGIDDFIIGAVQANPNGKNDAGQAYVIYGDCPPQLTHNILSIQRNQTLVMNNVFLKATDKNHENSEILFQ